MAERPLPMSDDELAALYRDLHAHPELSFCEHRTAAIAAERLAAWGYDVTTGVGGTGVVAVLDNGPGPTALLRADMDALPVQEQTGLDYASVVRANDAAGNDVPVMHACGHDVHVTCLLGAAAHLAADRGRYAGKLMLVFQPAEELGSGAQAMVDDGLYERFGRPDVVLGQHVGPLPAGMIGMHQGLSYSASDSMTVTLHGRGGHGSRPEATVDPIVLAAATVLRLQTIVSRETSSTESAVVTIGSLHAGAKENVIPDEAVLRLNVRTFNPRVRQRTLAAIERIVRAESQASDAPKPPDIDYTGSFPSLVNDEAGVARVWGAFTQRLDGVRVVDNGRVTGSEDVGVLATAAGAPCVYWVLGGNDPAPFAGAETPKDVWEVVRGLPSNHSPLFAPVVSPTLSIGVEALVTAAHAWLPAQSRP